MTLRTALLLAATFIFSVSHAKDYYVTVNGSGLRSGHDWNNAMDNRTFANGLVYALPGDVFHLSEGTYIPMYDASGNDRSDERTRTFLIRDGVSIRGGYDISGKVITDTVKAMSAVQLRGSLKPNASRGNNVYHVVTVADGANSGSSPALDRLTVSDGYANGGQDNSRGAGIFVGSKAGKVSPITFSQVQVSGNRSTREGCGIFIDSESSVSITRSQILGNSRISSSDVWGGGVGILQSKLRISDSRIANNSANHGGALHAVSGEIISYRCIYEHNSAGMHGGAIDVSRQSTVQLNSDRFVRNSAVEGGAIHSESRSVIKFKGCTISENTATVGGGIYNLGDCTAILDSCTVARNVANEGGGAYNRGTMSASKCRIIDNVAAQDNGGGISQSGNMTVANSEISGNSAKDGGGIHISNGSTTVGNTTLSGNTASGDGGGVCHISSTCVMEYVTVVGNTAATGKSSGVSAPLTYPAIRNSIISGNSNDNDFIGSNLHEVGDGSSFHNIIGALYYMQGNRAGQNIAFNVATHLGPLAFNRGASVRTHAIIPTGTTNNPAVGKGQYNINYVNDQTGFARHTKYPSLGAYEETFFKAFDDFIFIDGKSYIYHDILKNDAYPATCNPLVELVTKTSPKAAHISITQNQLIYMPKAGAKGVDTVRYKLECPNGLVDYANAIINLGLKYDKPTNIREESLCMDDMPSVNFKVTRKILNDKTKLDGFSSPLVGDINGDGKPEIIGLGATNSGGGDLGALDASGKSIVIYDGQTGTILLNFKLADLGPNKHDANRGYGTLNGFKMRWEPRHNSYSHMAIADLDRDGIGEIVVAETGSGKVYALKPVLGPGKRIMTLIMMWEVNVLHKHPYSGEPYSSSSPLDFGSPVPYISDLDGDGIPEVIVYNKIYNGQTGRMLLELETLNRFADPMENLSNHNKYKSSYAYVGRLPSADPYDDCIPAMAINDIDGDGVMEIIAGSKIYKPVIGNKDGPVGNSYKVKHGPSSVYLNGRTYYLTDGFTVVADIDGDDVHDVIVVKRHTDRNHLLMYVWDPNQTDNSSLKAVLAIEHGANTGHFSVPFVGDINGRLDGWGYGRYDTKLPEICLTMGILRNNSSYPIPEHPGSILPKYTDGQYTGDDGTGDSFQGHVAAFTYDAREANLSKRLKLSWLMKHSDISHQTGLVMFDFDADGINELVYRDETSLRVISPANRANGLDFVNLRMNDITHPAVIRFRQSGITSYTGFESPVVADVNADGSADIITFAYEQSGRTLSSGGHLMVYEAAGESWAPARSVWNQGIYYPLQINDDLTVPSRPQSTLTKYYSKLPAQAKGDTIRPFNGNWIQQPIVRKNNYVPILMTPDPSLPPDSISVISSSAARTVVRIVVENRGEATANSHTPIAFYHTSVNPQNRIHVTTLGADVFVGESTALTYTVNGDHRNKIIYVRLVDMGISQFPAPGFFDCDPTNNTACTMQVTAEDDYCVAAANIISWLDICRNDIYNNGLVPQISITESARNGVSLVAGSQISYIPNHGFQGIDTIRYRIQCTYNNITISDEATAYVLVLRPSSLEYWGCPGAMVTLDINPIPGVDFNWYDDEYTGNILAIGSNSYRHVKGASDETVWIQASVPNFPDFQRLRVNVFNASNCGSTTPSTCMSSGSPLFLEDFGGNSPADNPVSDTGNIRIKNYVYSKLFVDDSYTLRKTSGGLADWVDSVGDHTFDKDRQRGYMAQFRTTGAAGKLYEYALDDICEGSKIFFSAWIAGINRVSMPAKASLMFSIEDLNGNTIVKYYTGDVDDIDHGWKNYGFEFTVPPMINSIVVKIINTGAGDFVIDDIAAHLCVPEATLTVSGQTEICSGKTLDFTGSYTDDGTFGSSLAYRIEFREDASVVWQVINEGQNISPINITQQVTVTASGEYRFIVGRKDIIDVENCVAISKRLHVKAKNCNTRAVDDSVYVHYEGNVTFDVLVNDILDCNRGSLSLFDTLSGRGPRLGMLTVNPDSTFTYVAAAGASGIDSLEYRIVCNGTADTAKVYLLVNRPVPLNYACAGTAVKLGFPQISGVSYAWFATAGGGSAINTVRNDTLTVTKGSAEDLGEWWIEPEYGGIVFPRFAVYLMQADNCGLTVPSGCLAEGTVLLREDFGGNDSGSPVVKTSGLASVTGYGYVDVEDPVRMTDNRYSIRKIGAASAKWTAIGDHTSPSDNSKGYLAQYCVTAAPGQFYSTKIDNLCDGSNLMFSAWITGVSNAGNAHQPNIIFLIEDAAGNQYARYTTGNIPDSDVRWKNYGFAFTVPKGCSSLVLKIVNSSAGSASFVMDDVEIRLCTPKVQLAAVDSAVCINSPLVLNATYPDKGNPFGNSIVCRWEFRHIDSLVWKNIDERTHIVPLSVSWRINSADRTGDGFYRLLVGKQGSIDMKNCRASSDSIRVKVLKAVQSPDIRIQVSPAPARIVNLTSFLDSVNSTGILWEKVSVQSPVIRTGTDTTTGSINSTDFFVDRETYTYKYTASTKCGQSKAMTYVHAVKDRVLHVPDTITVCRNHESSKAIHLNQIIGLELGGVWKYDNSVNHDATVIQCVTEARQPSKYAGMLLFDAAKAWNIAPPQYIINYGGLSDTKAFRFEYHSTAAFNFPVKKTLVIVVTK
jgi:hypothetical protein